jgi:hypothetical protein
MLSWHWIEHVPLENDLADADALVVKEGHEVSTHLPGTQSGEREAGPGTIGPDLDAGWPATQAQPPRQPNRVDFAPGQGADRLVDVETVNLEAVAGKPQLEVALAGREPVDAAEVHRGHANSVGDRRHGLGARRAHGRSDSSARTTATRNRLAAAPNRIRASAASVSVSTRPGSIAPLRTTGTVRTAPAVSAAA